MSGKIELFTIDFKRLDDWIRFSPLGFGGGVLFNDGFPESLRGGNLGNDFS
jgi:hypothetical protein